MNTDSYIRHYVSEKFGRNPTKNELEKIEQVISQKIDNRSKSFVDPELGSILHTFKEYLEAVFFKSLYKERYLDLPTLSSSEINRKVREREMEIGYERHELTKSSLQISSLLTDSQQEQLHQVGLEIITAAKGRLNELLHKEDLEEYSETNYRAVDVWIGNIHYLLEHRDWSSLGTKHTSVPINSKNKFRLSEPDEMWEQVKSTFSDETDPIGELCTYTVSNTSEIFSYLGYSSTQQQLTPSS